ncbi:hypothetical protein GBA52_014389 [Prunus armeniaca]|nr:hypothetical protein GBA52_014389 [Prunus armeniaca]
MVRLVMNKLILLAWLRVFGRKGGTKSKVNAKGSRISLNDISTNNPKINSEELTAKGKAVIGGKLVVNKVSFNEQLANWVNAQKLYNEKWVYIYFGHQPPNINDYGVEHDEDCGTDDIDSLASSAIDGVFTDDKMDLAEGKMSCSNGNLAK